MTTVAEPRRHYRSDGTRSRAIWRMAKRLWPFLLASTVSLIPFTVFGMYLVPIAAAAAGVWRRSAGCGGSADWPL